MDEGHAFKVWPSYHAAIKRLSERQRLAIYDAMFNYGVEGIEPNFDDEIAAAIFEIIRPNIDKSVKAIESGKKGGEKNRREEPTQSTLSKAPSEAPFGTERERDRERDGESRSIGRNRKNGTRSRTERPVIVEKNPEEFPYL